MSGLGVATIFAFIGASVGLVSAAVIAIEIDPGQLKSRLWRIWGACMVILFFPLIVRVYALALFH